MKLVINADDYGMRASIDAAVESLFELGVLRSASLLVTGASARDAGAFLGAHPGLGGGLHLDLDGIFSSAGFGKDDHGRFLVPDIFFEQDDVRSAIHDRTLAQLESFKLMTGRTPDHLDGHHHAHLFLPVLQIILPLLQRFRVPAIRWFQGFYPTGWQAGAARDLIHDAGLATTKLFFDGVLLPGPQEACSAEVMVHPAMPVAAEEKWRAREYAGLADESFRLRLISSGYEPCTFADLAAAPCCCD
ncbi:MAG TPA: ChbG/HpnK family deacetylase [Spirochaetota bacterium]|nr:ChbG/HpnK family deacetylase [Spirochaetota bacterium]HPH02028.1 ChbG/HpnK family deacetylase [Spirochaetota bacterium]HPN82782.1 ChbG/HpnK family deacetylase [Spirochaetota bacterium]